MRGWRNAKATGHKYSAKRVLVCPKCLLIVRAMPKAEREDPDRDYETDEDRIRAWHTPGHPKQNCDGELAKMPSKLEASVWLRLLEAERRGQISGLRTQVVWPIEINGAKIGRYTCDFMFERQGRQRVVDSKGMDTPDSKFRRRIVEAIYGIEIEIWKKGKLNLEPPT